MKLFGYEWLKLWQRRLFMVLAVLLLAGNLLTLYILEKNTSAFFYVYENRELYQAFQAGDASVDANGWYQEKLDAQNSYRQSYAVFTGEMASRAEQMRSTAFFSDQDSFVYRNLRQTCADFAPFTGLEIKADNDFGLQALSSYNSGVLFLLVFLAVLSYFVIFHERDAGLTLLLKGNRRGHTPLALSKLAAMLSAAMLYVLLQETGTILFLGGIYGYGDLSRPLQSMSRFRNCAHFLTVGQGLVTIILLRIAAAVFFACLLFCIGMCIRNGAAAITVSAAVLGGGYMLYQTIPLSGGLNWLKCVNPFYCWSMAASLGEYLNLNLFGKPVNKGSCALAILGSLAVLMPAAGVLVFNRMYQVKSNSRLEKLLYWLRGKLSRLSHKTSLLYYEFYKMMVQQKKGIVLLLLLSWGIYETVNVFGPAYYAFDMGGTHFIVLDDIEYYGKKEYDERVSDRQLAWVEKYTAYLPEGERVCVAMHAPAMKYWRDRWQMSSNRRLMKLLSKYELHFLTGHSHINSNYDITPGVVEHNVGQVNGNLWHAPLNSDGSTKGLSIITESDGRWSWLYRTLGQGEDYQMRIWLPGELKEHKPFVVAKIWGWDPCWTVVWYEDGRYRGAMERLTMTDPDYMAFVDTVRVEPRIRRNLLKSIRNAEFYFRALPSADAREVRIVATDRDGRQWSQTVTVR